MIVLAALQLLSTQTQVVPKSGMVVTQSVSAWADGEHVISDSHEDGSGAAITIKGDNLVIDLKGCVLRGTPQTVEPDKRVGTGILVQGKNVTIRNANVHGFKIGLIAKDAPGLKILNSDFSYNWKQHLMSTLEKEDLADWMSFHQNEKNEWLKFGAAIYLDNCDGAEVDNTTAVGGQCGLMMTGTDNARVTNNNFSFLSAIGLGMYRSSKNTIMHNKIDWCVRGYSEGVYNRGQDSAGILIYEQSNENIFAYNSVTHGGDGFFLWAGQSTMDDGQGGCNDNLLVGNDFSHAPTNGIEATFSRNGFINNLMLECWHGIWGGYSWETIVLGNVFGMNGDAIAWEHGQDNIFAENMFHRDWNGINLWQNETQDPNWGYPKHRDTRSRDNVIRDNTFSHIAGASLIFRNTQKVTLSRNLFQSVGQLIRQEKVTDLVAEGNRVFATSDALAKSQFERTGFGTIREGTAFKPLAPVMQQSGLLVQGLDMEPRTYMDRFRVDWKPFNSLIFRDKLRKISDETSGLGQRLPAIPAPLANGKDPFIKAGELRGRRYIMVDEWGPYDFKSPILWPRKMPADYTGPQVFDILGPKGTWKVKSLTPGLNISANEGQVPGSVTLNLPKGQAVNAEVILEYVGGETTDYKGIKRAAGQAVEFSYRKFFMPVSWTVTNWSYDIKTQDPRTDYDAWKKAMDAGTKLIRKMDSLNFAWSGSPGQGISSDHFGTLAEGTFEALDGDYEITITSDDGVRVWLDGKLLVEDWTYHAPKTETKTVRLNGKHTLKVEHFELDGYSALKVDIKPKR